jgi:hypothetical protein
LPRRRAISWRLVSVGATAWAENSVGGPPQLPRIRTTPARDLPARAREMAVCAAVKSLRSPGSTDRSKR